MNWWIDDHPRSYGNINPVTWPCAHSADWKLWENPKSTGESAYSPNENSRGYPPCSHPSRTSDQNHPHSGIEPKSSWPFFLVTYTFQVSADWSHTPNIIRSLQWSWVQLYKHQQSQPVEMHCFYILRKSKYILCVYIYILCIYIYTHIICTMHILLKHYNFGHVHEQTIQSLERKPFWGFNRSTPVPFWIPRISTHL